MAEPSQLDPPSALDPAGGYRMAPDVTLRPERFGALAYHYRTRRLTFLRSVLLAEVVTHLGEHPTLDAALESMVPAEQRPAYRRALAALAASEVIEAH